MRMPEPSRKRERAAIIPIWGDLVIPDDSLVDDKDPCASEFGRRGGLKGGPARAKKLTPAERTESAKKAAEVRWAGKGKVV